MPGSGFVYLVGAGPGDPRLLTLRAYELLRAAEVVAHDELITPAILALIPPDAERLAVGRRAGAAASTYRLHPSVLQRAKAGQRIVRLKCGDPFVFGRGGEEAEELAEAGIPFEIVPGVSSAMGAAACAGIPLTHRLHASSVTFATGHFADPESPRRETIVLYMPSRMLGRNLAGLVARGHAPSTPAAYIAAATSRDQQVLVGTLADLAEKVGPDARTPALVIVGDVVGLRERIGWFESRPLRGRRLVVARARPGRSAIAAELRAAGAEVLELPDIEATSLDQVPELDVALAPRGELPAFRGIVFGCSAGVDAVATRLRGIDLPIFAVGPAAARALARHGINPAVSVRGACAEALREHPVFCHGGRFLLVTSKDGRPNLRSELVAMGAEVESVAAYHVVRRLPILPLPPIDLVVLPSSSAARAVLSGRLGDALREIPMVAMGPRTEEAARRHGAHRVALASNDSASSLVSSALSRAGAA